MIELNRVTLVGIDSWHPLLTVKAMVDASRKVKVSGITLVSDNLSCPYPGVNVLPLLKTKLRPERETFLAKRLSETFTTDFCLHMEWDSRVINPNAWNESWFAYDYIGAPWPYQSFPKYGSCHNGNCVGNSGFALISKRFADALATVSNPEPDEIVDLYVCIKLRTQLESLGLKFAPEQVAERFSCESRRYSGQFGWHGRLTAKINKFRL